MKLAALVSHLCVTGVRCAIVTDSRVESRLRYNFVLSPIDLVRLPSLAVHDSSYAGPVWLYRVVKANDQEPDEWMYQVGNRDREADDWTAAFKRIVQVLYTGAGEGQYRRQGERQEGKQGRCLDTGSSSGRRGAEALLGH